MIIKKLLKKVKSELLPLVLKEVFPAIEPLQEYVKNDKAIKKLQAKVKKLEGQAHPPIFAKKELEEIIDRLNVLEGK